jgi:antitoxin YefM
MPRSRKNRTARLNARRRAVVLMSAEDFDSLEETLEILSDPELVQEIATTRDEISRGETYTLEEVDAEMRARGRLPR